MDCLQQISDTENKAYLTKLKLEANSLKLLTNKIFSEIETNSGRKVAEESTNPLQKTVNNSSKVKSIQEIYDSLNKYLVVLIQFLDSREELQCQNSLPAVICSPTFFHLPSLCNMLWRRVEVLSKRSHDETKVTKQSVCEETWTNMQFSKSIQTEKSSLMYCESCNLSTELIKSLVHLILDAQRKYRVEKTNVSKIREKVRCEVFEMSQWGVMDLWTTAIKQDIEKLLKLTITISKTSDRLHHEKEIMRQEHNRLETTLQNDVDLARKQLEAEQAQKMYLNQQIENLNISLIRRIKQEKNLLRNIQDNEEKLKLIGESLTLLRDDCKQLRTFTKSLGTLVRSKILTLSRLLTKGEEKAGRCSDYFGGKGKFYLTTKKKYFGTAK